MTKLKNGARRVLSGVLSALLVSSAFASFTALNVGAVSYSEMSALDQYAYSGDDLGVTYSASSSTFKVWAPTASKVQLKRYKTGSDSESGAGVIETKDMTKQSQGIWSVTVSGDLKNTYYTYLVTVNGTTKETVDIYARSTGVNGKRGMVVDLDSTDPVGWENDKRVDCPNQTDSIIWEAHVRDFSASSDSGMKNKGKYLAFTETGTTVNSDGVHPTGIDYLEDLGVTHVHLLPVYDYGSVDETMLSTDQFNWGYDPMNYNTPEGSYSTDPYKGEVRVNEFKQMVQALHNKNIGVVMDVVYNHTYAGSSGINDWFDYTVPGYYYRQKADGSLSNGSGCGNETASDRAMYQKYMIDSVVYWATEYHLDGFRFDLMGIHDVDTMNKIRAALDKIDPDILIYGEPWTAEASPCPKATAVQSNMGLVSEEVAAFNDKVRDAIKGSCFNAADKGFIQGAGYEEALKGGIQASSTTMSGDGKWSKQPSQTVTYTSAHDNFTLYDKLVKSVKGSGYGVRYDDLVAMNKLAGGIILTSQGMSFWQAGEEFARSKQGDGNSYKSSTAINQLKWQNTIDYSDITSYYKGLIQIRKAYAPFRDPTNTSNNTIYFSWGDTFPSNVVAFTMYNKLGTGGWNFAAVIHNANSYSQTVKLMTYDGVTLPSSWVIVANGTSAGITSLGTTGSTVTVPARSTMVLIDKTSFDSTVISDKCTVKVNHVLKSTGEVYKTETLKGDEGASYTTSALSELTSQGYTVASVTGNQTGTFTKAGSEVTYYYELDSSKYGTVTVKYQDETGKSIASDDILTGLIGSSYSTSARSIDGYELSSTPANASGTYASTAITVKYVYKVAEVSGLVVHYYNANNWSNVNLYAYQGDGASAVQLTGVWPGTAMKGDGNGWWSYAVTSADSGRVIFNNGTSQEPAAQQPGYSAEGEVWVKNGTVYPTGKVTVNYTTTDGQVLATESLKGMADGVNQYTTTAKSFDGYELSSTPTNSSGVYTKAAIVVNYIYKASGVAVTSVSLSKTSLTLDKGKTATLSATVAPANATDKTISWSSSDSSVATVSQSGLVTAVSEGTAIITATSSNGKTATATVKVNGDVVETLTNTSTLSSESITLGNSVTVKCSATGGSGSYQYGVYYKKASSASYSTVQSYGSNASVNIKPSAAVKYDICVKVKDSKGTIAKKYFTLDVSKTSTKLTNTSTLSSESITLGNSVTVKCSATGGSGSYQYGVYYKKASSTSYSTVQSYKSNATVTITPGAAVDYDICVKVKDSKGTIEKKYFTLNVSKTNTKLTNTSKLSSESITLGDSVTVKCSGTGGSGSYQYGVYYKKASSTSYSTVQSYKSNATVTITPSAAVDYDICVKVKDSKGTIEKKYFTLTVSKTSGELKNTSTLSKTTISLGDSVTLRGAASGGSGGYTYAYYSKFKNSDSWTTLSSYSSKTSYKFTPESNAIYDICIKVKDSKGTVAKSYFTLNVTE